MSNAKSHVKPGDKAADFTTLDDSGGRVSLVDFKGRWVVLFFYPKDDRAAVGHWL
jgi:peroxiredoxin Q/BCP